MTALSKFGFSQNDNNNTAGAIGPRGQSGASGQQGIQGLQGDKGEQGEPGNDAKFPLDVNYGDIIGIASLSGGVGSSMYINRCNWSASGDK